MLFSPLLQPATQHWESRVVEVERLVVIYPSSEVLLYVGLKTARPEVR